MAEAPKKKYGTTFDVIKQSVREKFSDTEINEDPAVRAQIDKVENHRKLVTDLSRHLTALKRSHTAGKQEEKNIIESWTLYADKLSTNAECPELEKAMRKLILVEKYVEEITGKMNDHFSEKSVLPVHNYGETEMRDGLRWKDRYNDIRVRYDALVAKKSSSEKHQAEKSECYKDLQKMGDQTVDALKKCYARSEMVHFECIIGRYEALVEFFDLGQLYMNERKAEILQFKADWDRRKLEIQTGKKVDVTRSPGGTTVFNVPIMELLAREKRPDTEVPLIVEKTCEYLYAKGLDSEGIFRVSPAGSQMEKFKTQVNQGNYDFSWIIDPNVVGAGLKFFLRSLPDPIFTAERYRGWLNCIGRGDDVLELEALKKIVDELPPQNHVLIKTIMLLLKAVLEHEDKNKMSTKALCVVMGPNLIWSREATRPEDMLVDSEKTNALFTLMMKNVPYLFTEKNIWKLVRRGDVAGVRALATSEKIDLMTIADESGQLILHVGAKCGFLPIVKFMIEEIKMPVDQKDLLEVTPLGHALMNKNEEVALYLIEKRANHKSEYKDKVDFESRAKMLGTPFFTKYTELIAKVTKEDREKAELDSRKKANDKEQAEKELAAKLRADEEARWAKELEIAQKRAARDNPALASLGAAVGAPQPSAEEQERAERERREAEEREDREREKERARMQQLLEAERLKEEEREREREREEKMRKDAERERDRLAALLAADKAEASSRASVLPPLPSQQKIPTQSSTSTSSSEYSDKNQACLSTLTSADAFAASVRMGSSRAVPLPATPTAGRNSNSGQVPASTSAASNASALSSLSSSAGRPSTPLAARPMPPTPAALANNDPDAPPLGMNHGRGSSIGVTASRTNDAVASVASTPAAALLPSPAPPTPLVVASPSQGDEVSLPRLEQLLGNAKLNIPELLAAISRLVRLCVAPTIDLPACNVAVREVAVEVKGLFNHSEADVLEESSDEDRDAFFAQARKLQEGMKHVIGALKEVSQSAEPADRIPALQRSLAYLVGPGVSLFSAFEGILSAQIAGLTGGAANQLTAALQIAVGKTPAAELYPLADSSLAHYIALTDLVKQKALEVADADAEEKLVQAATSLLASRAALFQTANTMVTTPSDDMAKANLSAVAKVLASQFSQLNAISGAYPLHRALTSHARAAAEAQQEKEMRNLRDLISLLSLPDPEVARRLIAAVEALVLLRTLPVGPGALYFDSCTRVGDNVRIAVRRALNMRLLRAPESGSLLKDVTRHSAAALQLAAFVEIVGSSVALNFALEPEASLTHVLAGLIHAISGLVRHLTTL